MANLRDPLAVVGVVGPPEPQRVDIVILAVEVDALLRQELIHMLGEPLAGFRLAQVQQSVVARAQQPLGMLLEQPTAPVRPLRLEPQHQFLAFGVGVVRNRPDAFGEPLRIGLPSSGV